MSEGLLKSELHLLHLHSTETRLPRASVSYSLTRLSREEIQLTFEIARFVFVEFREPSKSKSSSSKPVPPKRLDGLWRETCFECFLVPSLTPSLGASGFYYEWNLAPFGDWQLYRFDAYRGAANRVPSAAPRLEQPQFGIWQWTLPLPPDLMELEGDGIDAGVSCVMIEKDVDRPFYWAKKHCSEKPDFHSRESMCVRVPRFDEQKRSAT